jgi:hypothetical protein
LQWWEGRRTKYREDAQARSGCVEEGQVMKVNMGTADRAIRTVVAIVIIVLWLADVISGTLALILGIVAALLLVTSVVRICPAYLPFGLSTCGKDEAAPPAKP